MGNHRAVQAAAHAVKLGGDGVGAAEEGVDSGVGKGIVLGAQHHPEGVHRLGRELGPESPVLHMGQSIHRGPEANLVALLQLAALKAADFGFHIGGPAAHGDGDVQPSGEGDEGPAARLGGGELQHLAGLDGHRLVVGNGFAVQGGAQVSAGDGNHICLVKLELGAHHGALQHRLPLVVAGQDVGQSGGPGVHHPGHRHAELLIAHAALVLDGGEQAGVQYGDTHVPPSFLG